MNLVPGLSALLRPTPIFVAITSPTDRERPTSCFATSSQHARPGVRPALVCGLCH